MSKVAILAGKGILPLQVYHGCVEKGVDCVVIGLEGQFSSDLFANIPVSVMPAHAVSAILVELKQQKVTTIVLAGKVERASISKLMFDKKGSKLFAAIIKKGLQDNNVLTAIITFLESEGFAVMPAESFACNIVAPNGVFGALAPDASAMQDIEIGLEILQGIASYDIGQALIIQSGLVLGVEAAEGTDELIKRCASLQQANELPAILIKISKPHQDQRVDLPCVGINTVENIAKAGMRGIAVEAGKSLLLSGAEMQKNADKCGVFIYGFSFKS